MSNTHQCSMFHFYNVTAVTCSERKRAPEVYVMHLLKCTLETLDAEKQIRLHWQSGVVFLFFAMSLRLILSIPCVAGVKQKSEILLIVLFLRAEKRCLDSSFVRL